MSVLSQDVHNELTELLNLLQSPDNEARSRAENHLQTNWTDRQPHVLLMGLAEQIQGSSDNSIRNFAAVLFRRIASKQRKDDTEQGTYVFLTFPQNQASVIRQKLLEALATEEDRAVRNKISDAIAEIARQYAEFDLTWDELLVALFQLSISPVPEKRETAYRVFNTTPGIIERQHEDTVLAAFNKGFKDEVLTVRLIAMEAFTSFFHLLNRKAQAKYQPLIPDILNILPPMMDEQDSENLSRALIALVDIVVAAPKMFKQLFDRLVEFCVNVIQEKNLDDSTRQNALELLVTFAECAPSMCRNHKKYIESMITQCLSLMTDLGEDDDDASEWLANDDLDQDDNDLNHVAGEQAMDRIATKLGGEVILAPVFAWLPRMMTSNWKDKHAALMAISAISEGCCDLMKKELDKVLDLVVPALKDAHPRVRWAGCNALGQMSTDFAPLMQQKYPERVLKSIIPVLKSPEARVKSHAAAALVNFCEEAEKSILEPHLLDLLSHLFELLQNDQRYVQEQALSTIATIADAAEAAFSNYYDTLMPLLINVLQQPSDKDRRLLRSKAMECATLIALAVGRERLGADAETLVNLLTTVQNSITDDDDPQAQYLMHCWGRMCRVLESEFVSCLPIVMPPLLEIASAKCDIVLLEDEEEATKAREDEGWEFVPIKGKMMGVNTSMMDDRFVATELLVVYAKVLQGEFAPYAQDIMEKIAIPGLDFIFYHPVRTISAKLVPQLLSCVKKAYGPQSAPMASIWIPTLNALVKVLGKDASIETLAELYQGFYESVEIAGKNSMTPGHMASFINSAKDVLNDYTQRVEARIYDLAENTPDDAEDQAEERELAIEEDQTLLSDMNKAFHAVFKNHGTDFLPAWKEMLDVYESFLSSPDPTQRQWGLCIVDDVLEYCGHESLKFDRYINQPLINGCTDASPSIRQAAAYGIGEAARCGGPGWAPFVAGSLPFLFQSTQIATPRDDLDPEQQEDQTPTPRDEHNVFATENACIAISKVLRFNTSQIPNVAEVQGQWLLTLPVTHDEEGAPYAYAYLSELINQQHPAVVPQASNIFVHVAEALSCETIKGEVARRAVAATKALVISANVDAASLLQQFPFESQQMIQNYFK